MSRQTRTAAIALVVALALCVGGSPSVLAKELTPKPAVATINETGGLPMPPQLTADNGDPDDWAAKKNQSVGSWSAELGENGGPKAKWLNYLELLSGLLVRIKLYLIGIL